MSERSDALTMTSLLGHDDPGLDAVDLDRFFRPRTVAIVGAHDEREPLANLTKRVFDRVHGSGGTVYPVNPKLTSVYGIDSLDSVEDLPESVDALIVLIGDPIPVIRAAAAHPPRFVMVFAGGFAELGTAEARQREAELAEASRSIGARLYGPNTNMNALEQLRDGPSPKLAVVSQSGMQGRPIAQSQELGVILSYWATTGNEADLELAHFIDFFGRDESTNSIAAYAEGFKSGSRLRDAVCTAAEHGTPVTMIKVGRSAAGASMAVSHTGHLAGSDSVHDAFFEQFGINRVDDLDEWYEVSLVLNRCPLPTADGVALNCISGGTAAQLVDLLGAADMRIPTLGEDTQAQLREFIPDTYRVSNPVDNGGPPLMRGHGTAINMTILSDPEVGVLLVPLTGVFENLIGPAVDAIIEAKAQTHKPIIPIWAGPTADHPAFRKLYDAGLPVARNLRNALKAVQALMRHPTRNGAVQETVAAARKLPPVEPLAADAPRRHLDEVASTEWLRARGISFAASRTAATVDAAADAAAELGYPVVLKAYGPTLLHKSERNLVQLGLDGPEALRAAAARIAAEAGDDLAGFVVAEFLTSGLELIIGVSHDPVMGPVVLLGSGGTAAEASPDVALSVLPVTRRRAAEMVDRLRIAPLLGGWRGSPALDRQAIIEAVLTMAEIAAEGSVAEVDINPLLVTPSGVLGLDALVSLRAGDRTS